MGLVGGVFPGEEAAQAAVSAIGTAFAARAAKGRGGSARHEHEDAVVLVARDDGGLAVHDARRLRRGFLRRIISGIAVHLALGLFLGGGLRALRAVRGDLRGRRREGGVDSGGPLDGLIARMDTGQACLVARVAPDDVTEARAGLERAGALRVAGAPETEVVAALRREGAGSAARPRSSSMGAGLAIGVGVGVAMGVAMDSLVMGVAIGVALGIAFALVFDARATGGGPPD